MRSPPLACNYTIHQKVEHVNKKIKNKSWHNRLTKIKKVNVTEALLKAILELIEKCETLDDLRESVKRIMDE